MERYSPENDDLASEIIRLFRTNEQQFVAPPVLRKIYKMYVRWRQSAKPSWPGVRSFERDVVYYLMERCYWINYGDSDLATTMLTFLYEIDGHFGCLFLMEFFSDVLEVQVRTFWNNQYLGKQTVHPADYFAYHANKRKHLIDGKRLFEHQIPYCGVWMPACTVAWFSESPTTFQLFLCHGALINENGQSQLVTRFLRWSIGTILSACSSTGIGVLSTSKMNVKYTSLSLFCGNAVLRIAPSVNMNSLFRYCHEFSLSQKISLINQLSSAHLLPKLRNRCLEPLELQHICRRVIRKALYDNWRLPSAVQNLPLPRILREYVNLERD